RESASWGWSSNLIQYPRGTRRGELLGAADLVPPRERPARPGPRRVLLEDPLALAGRGLEVENVGPSHETEPEHRRARAESVARHLDVEHPPALSIEPRCVRQLRLDSARQTGRSVDLREPLLAIGRNRLGDCHYNTPDGR